jgi:hypothetical protein
MPGWWKDRPSGRACSRGVARPQLSEALPAASPRRPMAWLLGALTLCLTLASPAARAQEDPALKVVSERLVEAYLRTGPGKSELPDGSATANWAIMQKVGLPTLLLQEQLQVGNWASIWGPVRAELEKRNFSLEPLEALTWWEETAQDPQRFLRLLAQRGLLDARVPKDRNRGTALRDALGMAATRLEEVRANVRFEKAGWSFTGTVSLVPDQRVVRLVLRGSQPCSLSGKLRASNVALKGRLFVDQAAPGGLKVQLLDQEFSSNGCEETLQSKIAAMVLMTGGGEARVTGNLVVQLKDETLTGRLELDLAFRQPGNALQTGHGVYALRGSLSADGNAHATLTPVSTSGDKLLREGLNKAGALEGTIKAGQGSGGISMPLFRQTLNWRASGS